MRHIKRLQKCSFSLALLACLSLCGCGLFKPSPPPPPLPAKAANVVKTAYTQMGQNYRSGGASPGKGFDCSGLIWWAYKQNGINLPRITRDQAKIGSSVPRKKIRSGDILVFRTGRGPNGLHAGLYAGDGSFIHSPRAGKKVCLEKMDKAFWQKHLLTIRRVCR